MKKAKNVFSDNFRIETQTVFNENGNINIYPCHFEEKHFIVADGNQAKQKGRMVTEDDGTSLFRPYAVDSGSRYNTLFSTAHGTMKESKNDIIVQLRLPKRLGKAIMKSILYDEAGEMCDFIKTRRKKIFWAW